MFRLCNVTPTESSPDGGTFRQAHHLGPRLRLLWTIPRAWFAAPGFILEGIFATRRFRAETRQEDPTTPQDSPRDARETRKGSLKFGRKTYQKAISFSNGN